MSLRVMSPDDCQLADRDEMIKMQGRACRGSARRDRYTAIDANRLPEDGMINRGCFPVQAGSRGLFIAGMLCELISRVQWIVIVIRHVLTDQLIIFKQRQ